MIIELLSCVGLMWILKDGSILRPLRSLLSSLSPIFKDLFNCSLCLGFWSGLIVGLVSYYYIEDNYLYFYFPLASAALCWLSDSILDLIQVGAAFFDNNT